MIDDHLPADRIELRRPYLPQLLLLRWAGLVVTMVALVGLPLGFTDFADLLLVLLIGIAAPLLLHRLHRAHRVSYDDEAVYIRPDGLLSSFGLRPEVAVPFSAIAAVVAEPPTRIDRVRSPHVDRLGYVRVYCAGGDRAAVLRIDVISHVRNDVRSLLSAIEERKPGVLNRSLFRWMARR